MTATLNAAIHKRKTITSNIMPPVLPQDHNIRLDRWFKRYYPALPHAALQKMLRTKDIRVDGKRAEANQRLFEGQEIRLPPMIEKGDHTKAEQKKQVISEEALARLVDCVIYQDDIMLALNKPSGLAVQGGSGVKESVDYMLDGLKFDAKERPKLVHRLDKDTSGVLLLARDTQTATLLTGAFKGRDVQKTYWAVVAGVPKQRKGVIDIPLAPQGKSGNEKMMPAEQGGQKAITHYEILASAGKKAAWLAVYPETGRKHQIRTHLAAIGYPIVGDGKYGGKDAFVEGLSKTLHLHAREVRLKGVLPGEVTITAEMPEHIEVTLHSLKLL
jgi:23S rRNA pseudouridine955/2504/2580 synthase